MKNELEYALKRYQEAFQKLKQGVSEAKDELDKDGVIQRFEFTVEQLWKTLKIYLADQGIDCKTPKECLKKAFRAGIIEDEALFLDMLEDRNKTSHLYHKEASERIFQSIKDRYLSGLEKSFIKLQ